MEPFLGFVAGLAAKLTADHQDGVAPDWRRAIGSWRLHKRHTGSAARSGPVTVRYVEPRQPTPEEAARARAKWRADRERERRRQERINRETPNLA